MLVMKYFVLKPRGDTPGARASRKAMLRYADEIAATEPELARGLADWVRAEVELLQLEGKEG